MNKKQSIFYLVIILLALLSFATYSYFSNNFYSIITSVANVTNVAKLNLPQSSTQFAAVDGPSSGLIGWWKLDETAGTVANDSSGNGKNGTLGGSKGVPIWTSGDCKVNGCIDFNGVADYVNIGDIDGTRNQDFSVSAWVKVDNQAYRKSIVAKKATAGTGASLGWTLDSHYGEFQFIFGDGTNYIYDHTNPIAATSTWYHVVGVFDWNARSGSVYVNGVKKSNQVTSASPVGTIDSTLPLRIGADASGSSIYGTVDDVRMYNRMLSDSEISDLYKYTETKISDMVAPTVSVTFPTAGSVIKGNAFISATASDPAPSSGLVGVQFKIDGNNIGSEITAPPFSMTTDTTKLTVGQHEITAVVRDAAGNNATSASVSVTVDNAPPVVIPVTPLSQQSANEAFPGQSQQILSSWNWFKNYYYTSMVPPLAVGDTNQLYNLQQFTNNLLIYSFRNKNLPLFDEILNIYLDPYKYLTKNSAGEYRWIYNLNEPASLKGIEVSLHSGQYMYAVASAIRMISSLDPSEQTATMKMFVAQYWPVVVDFYSRSEAMYRTSIRNKLGAGLSLKNYSNAVGDQDLWMMAGIAELLGAHKRAPNLVPISTEQENRFGSFLNTGIQLVNQRLTWSNLTDFSGGQVKGLNFDLGMWDSYPDFQYSGYQGIDFPGWKVSSSENTMAPAPSTNVGWDISHARRFVNVFDAFYQNRDILGLSFPTREMMVGFANQLTYGVFNKEFSKPLFSNFMDGANGWYRVNYSGRANSGYAPYKLSDSVPTGGYGFWAEFNPDINKIMTSIYNVATSGDSNIRSWNKFYMNNYANGNYPSVSWLMFLPSIIGVGNISVAPVTTITQPVSASGSCGTALNSCSVGTFSDLTDTTASYLWQCNGYGSGVTVSCNLPISTQPSVSPNIVPVTTPEIPLNAVKQTVVEQNVIAANPKPQTYPDTRVMVTKLNTTATKPFSAKPTVFKPIMNLDNSLLTIPTTTIDIVVPKVPSWIEVLIAIFKEIANRIKMGAGRTVQEISNLF